MNEINNNNDPFEDVFRDRFADFESEPDTQLWQKIEPKLPVDSTRKFPYWQTSAVVILLLAGLWIYREKYSDNVVIKSDEFQTENINPPLSVSTQTTKINNPTTNPSPLSVSSQTTQSKNTTKKSDEKIDIEKLPNRSLQDDKESFGVNENDKITNGNVENSLISEGKINIAKFPNKSLKDDKESFVVSESSGSSPFEGRLPYSTKEVKDNNFAKNNAGNNY
jgi:hypothetical protein